MHARNKRAYTLSHCGKEKFARMFAEFNLGYRQSRYTRFCTLYVRLICSSQAWLPVRLW
jgi:hypothetical protein